MYVYCLFCQTQRCKLIASLLEMRGVDRAFSPQIIRRQRKQGENLEQLYDLLPGYVFVYSEKELFDPAFYYGIDGVLRRLGRLENRFQLTDSDLEFAMNLYEKNGVIGAVMAIRVGDQVELKDPLFLGCEGKITQLDVRKQRARVDFVFNQMHCFTWIACDLVKKTDQKEQAPAAEPV